MRPSLDPADPALTFAALALLLPPMAVLAPLGFAPLGAVAVSVILLQGRRLWQLLDRSTFGAVLLFIAWGAISALWSPTPDRTLTSIARVGVICVGGMVLVSVALTFNGSQRHRVGLALALGAGIAALFLTVDLVANIRTTGSLQSLTRQNPITSLNQTASAIVVLCWPLTLLTSRRWRAAGALGVPAASFFVVMLLEPSAPPIALLVSGVIFVLALCSARLAVKALTTGLIIAMLAIPLAPDQIQRLDNWLTNQQLNESAVSHRLGIWSFTIRRIKERPLTGWGFDTARVIPGGRDNVRVLGKLNPDAPAIPLHPHNASLQIWLEAGLPGLLLAAFIVLRCLRRIPLRVADPFEVAILMATATTLLVVASLSYGIWQGWWLCFIWLVIALTLALTAQKASD